LKILYSLIAVVFIATSAFAGPKWALWSTTTTDTIGSLTAGGVDTTIAYPYKQGMSFQALVTSSNDSIIVSGYPIFSNVPKSYNSKTYFNASENRYFTATIDTLGSSDFDAISANGIQAIQSIPMFDECAVTYVRWAFAGNATTNEKSNATTIGVIITYPEE